MTVLWGTLGVAFSYWLVPLIDQMFDRMQGRFWKAACSCMSIFMAINLAFTALCLIRWRDRHEGIAPQNYVEQTIDEVYDDYKMEKRFCEWSFIDGLG